MSIIKRTLIALVMLSCCALVHAKEKVAEVKDIGFGMFVAEYDNLKIHPFHYRVDTIAEICYVVPTTSGSVNQESWVVVPCKKLKNRPEWKSIIDWDV